MHHAKDQRPPLPAQHGFRRRAAFGVVAVCSLTIAPLPLEAQDVPGWVQEIETRWWTAVEEGDVRALRSLFTADAVLLDHQSTVRGRDRVEEFATALFRSVRFECDWSIEDVHVVHQLATVSSSASCTVTPRNRGEPQARSMQFLKVYEQQADGSWLIGRMSDQPSLQP